MREDLLILMRFRDVQSKETVEKVAFEVILG